MVSIQAERLKRPQNPLRCDRRSKYCWCLGFFFLIFLVTQLLQYEDPNTISLLTNAAESDDIPTASTANATISGELAQSQANEKLLSTKVTALQEDRVENSPVNTTSGKKADEEAKTTTKRQPVNDISSELAMLPIHRPNHKLPQWMLDYFVWHGQERKQLHETNWNTGQFKFLIMRCLNEDSICGGTSDRLQSLPYQLLIAHMSQRILLILWERPFPLEEFLLPPLGAALDWRVPSYMREKVVNEHKDVPITYAGPQAKQRLMNPATQKKVVMWTRDQTHNHGKAAYDQYHEGLELPSRFESVFHDAWRMVFTPASPVARKIEHWMHRLGLVPGEYASTHVRALYGVHNRSQEQIEEWTQNAIHCTTQLRPEGPFFFASDSTDAQRMALDYGKKVGLKVVSRFHEIEPLHVDGDSTGRVAEEYHDAFVDLYLLGNAGGTAYNVGGYGKLGLIMGFDSSAGIQHQRGGVPWARGVTGVKLHHCDLKRPQSTTPKTRNALPATRPASFFAPPMEAAT